MPDRGADAEIHEALLQWTAALASGQGESAVVALYAPDAVLLATFDPNPLDTPAAIAGYFRNLTKNPNLKATIQRENIEVFGDGAANSGLYTFSYTKDGSEVRVPARFVFVYRRSGSGWLIVSHHSSTLPAPH